MNSALTQLIQDSDSRYLTREEQRKILTYAASLPQRLQAASAIEQREEAIVRATIDQVRRRYPRFEKLHNAAWARCFRDVQLVVRYACQAMVCDDPEMLSDRLLYWMRSILAASGFSPQLLQDTYNWLRENARKELASDAFALIEPYLNQAREVLSDFPEPAVAAV